MAPLGFAIGACFGESARAVFGIGPLRLQREHQNDGARAPLGEGSN